MTDRAALAALIRAVEDGTLPIIKIIPPESGDPNDIHTVLWPVGSVVAWDYEMGADRLCRIGEAYEGDLNAAVRLCGELLPGWDWAVESAGTAYVWHRDARDMSWDGCNAATPARALLLAVIKARMGEG